MNRRGLGTDHIDGRYEHYFSQSLINTFMMCPEQARYELAGTVPHLTTPRQALGTAFHAAAEAILQDKLALNMTAFDYYERVLLDTYQTITEDPGFVECEGEDLEWARKKGVTALSVFCDDLLPELRPVAIEKEFQYLLYEDATRRIFMKGTIDLIDENGVVWDWKTSASERKEWKDKRGSVQAAAYTKAVPTNYFTYAVFHEKGFQRVELVQGQEHWQWLAWQALSLAKTVEADFAPWPVDDSDWWCSPKWCNVFAAGHCKGQFFPRRIEIGK